MKLKIADLVAESIVDGFGLRAVVFTQGCPHRCKGCHNPQTHDFEGGRWEEVEQIAQKLLGNPLLSGVTFSGGEPMCQAKPLVELAKICIKQGLNITIYTGYTFEQLLSQNDPDQMELLSLCDVLIDGRFVEEQRDLTLQFRGSRNQRILDCKESIRNHSASLCDDTGQKNS